MDLLHYRKTIELGAGVVKSMCKREKPIRWKCAVCGYIHEGKEPPKECPSCKHPREYYEPESMEF